MLFKLYQYTVHKKIHFITKLIIKVIDFGKKMVMLHWSIDNHPNNAGSLNISRTNLHEMSFWSICSLPFCLEVDVTGKDFSGLGWLLICPALTNFSFPAFHFKEFPPPHFCSVLPPICWGLLLKAVTFSSLLFHLFTTVSKENGVIFPFSY